MVNLVYVLAYFSGDYPQCLVGVIIIPQSEMSIGKKWKIVGNYTAVLMSFRKTFSPELVSGLFRNPTLMLKQVQHDNIGE